MQTKTRLSWCRNSLLWSDDVFPKWPTRYRDIWALLIRKQQLNLLSITCSDVVSITFWMFAVRRNIPIDVFDSMHKFEDRNVNEYWIFYFPVETKRLQTIDIFHTHVKSIRSSFVLSRAIAIFHVLLWNPPWIEELTSSVPVHRWHLVASMQIMLSLSRQFLQTARYSSEECGKRL